MQDTGPDLSLARVETLAAELERLKLAGHTLDSGARRLWGLLREFMLMKYEMTLPEAPRTAGGNYLETPWIPPAVRKDILIVLEAHVLGEEHYTYGSARYFEMLTWKDVMRRYGHEGPLRVFDEFDRVGYRVSPLPAMYRINRLWAYPGTMQPIFDHFVVPVRPGDTDGMSGMAVHRLLHSYGLSLAAMARGFFFKKGPQAHSCAPEPKRESVVAWCRSGILKRERKRRGPPVVIAPVSAPNAPVAEPPGGIKIKSLLLPPCELKLPWEITEADIKKAREERTTPTFTYDAKDVSLIEGWDYARDGVPPWFRYQERYDVEPDPTLKDLNPEDFPLPKGEDEGKGAEDNESEGED